MKLIPLTQGKFAQVDDADFEELSRFSWCAVKGKRDTFYAFRRDKQRRGVPMHRQITDAPEGLKVDHIDTNGLNNCRDNLRLATNAENMWNSRARLQNRSGIKGVYEDKRRGTWCWAIAVQGVRHYGTGFLTKELAAEAAAVFRSRHHGRFARQEAHE
jgi:hypothetical protein